MARSKRDREQIVADLQQELESRPEVLLALLHGSVPKGAFRYHALQGRPLVTRDEEFLKAEI